jgi:hypothetical protein
MVRKDGKREWRITRLIGLMKGWMGGWKVVVGCRGNALSTLFGR